MKFTVYGFSTTTASQSSHTLPHRLRRGGGWSWDSRRLRLRCAVGGREAVARNDGGRRGRRRAEELIVWIVHLKMIIATCSLSLFLCVKKQRACLPEHGTE